MSKKRNKRNKRNCKLQKKRRGCFIAHRIASVVAVLIIASLAIINAVTGCSGGASK